MMEVWLHWSDSVWHWSSHGRYCLYVCETGNERQKKEKATECVPVVRAKKGTIDHLLPS